jgi:zinc-ribbon domain
MMYNQKLVASIKSKGKILREFKDTVYIPFASEYSILLKNLNTVRAVVNVFIDGENAVPGGLVIDPGRSVDLERWIKNGNLSEGNRFKFIERTAKIEEGPRGIKEEDGLIRVEYQFEIPRPVINVNNIVGSFPYYPPGVRSSEYQGVVDKYSTTAGDRWIQASGATYSQVNVNGALRGVDYSANGGATAQAASAAVDKYCADNGLLNTTEYHDGAATMDWCANETGITVPGSKSEQKFQTTTVGALDPTKHTIVLRIVGDLGHNKPVEKPVTVKHKPKCVTCGKQNKAHAKFCTECGTALEIFA